MKPIFKALLKYYLKYVAKLVLFIHKPVIIVVSGSTNKTFARDEIKRIMKENNLSARANSKSFNTEIGLPLAILDLSSGYGEYRNWLPAIKGAIKVLFKINFPKFLVLELGVSKKGDMEYLLSIIEPEVSVITNITQRYIESFSGMDDLVEEYNLLARKTKKSGLIVINGDNSRAEEIGKSAQTDVFFYGRGEKCQAKILKIEREATGEVVKVSIDGKIRRRELNRFGEHHAYAFAVALLVEKYVIDKYIESR